MALIYEKKDHLAIITLNRPEARNSIDPETAVALDEAWRDYRSDPEMRCAVITGAGEQAFCTGADLARLIPLITGARKPETEADHAVAKNPGILQNAFLRELSIYKPIVAAINGYAIAGGMEMLYNMDIRIASEDAKFGLQEVKWAVFPMMGSTVRLPRQIPYAKAMELLLTGELMDAKEALSMGFVNRVVEKGKVMDEALRVAGVIAKNGPLAVSAIKKSVLKGLNLSIKEALAKEVELGIPVFMSEDAKEGPRAFKEKREPRYQGK
ncbi:MAG: enoyl-CoA hydratase/isomerase family protein [Deltaproteobacteria bacterium]|nr:enoyl-CoA hydratase/isomerase family protein [Deltaproteobacteria bacterium]